MTHDCKWMTLMRNLFSAGGSEKDIMFIFIDPSTEAAHQRDIISL